MLDAFYALIEPERLTLSLIAVAVSVLASYTGFSLAVQPARAERIRYPWLIAAGVATGSGAWATYLIMLLGNPSDVPFTLEFIPIASSLALGVIGCTFGIVIARNHDHMHIGGLVLGFTVAGTFYTGMQGVEFAAIKQWDMYFTFASFVLSASCGAAALARGHLSPDIRGRFVSTLVLATGIVGTFVLGFAGLTLIPDPSLAVSGSTAMAVLFGISLTAVVMLIIGLGLVGSLVDRYVDEIEKARDELEKRVEERTAALSAAKERAELEAAAKEKAARAKAEFLANMSHELRTPLNAIIGFSDLIANASMGPLPPRYSGYGNDIHKSGLHLLALVNDVLDLSKLESGKFELHQERLSVSDLLDGCRSMISGLAREAKVRLLYELPDALPLVWADPLRLKQIVVNLLSNAIKFSKENGEVTVNVSLSADHELIIKVQDSGIGMTPEGIVKALEPFGQIDNAWNREHSGTGLGLPVVKHLVELHGGTLQIFSKPDVGTTVAVRLPLESVSAQAVA
jgi:signal transduction histidine kinase